MTDGKLLRFVAVLIVLGGYAIVFRAGEAQVAARLAENARDAQRLRADERALATRGALDAERVRLRGAFDVLALAADRSTLTARFLHDAARLATAHRTTIAGVVAGAANAPAPVGSPVPGAPAVPFDTIPLDIALEGRYADVLATIGALSRARVLASVDVASIAHKDGPNVTASLRVVLERIAPQPPGRAADAPSRSV